MQQSVRSRSPLSSLFQRLERGGASDRLILKLGFFAILAVAILLAITLSQQYAAVVPVRGGTLTEGVIGVPRFVNPALAITRADQDMTALVYSGLMRLSVDGTLVPDVAESVTRSDDGRTYTFALRRNVTFHDGAPLTASDVAFTIALIQDPDLKSPLRGTWNDVSVNVIDEYTIAMTLEEAYAPFIENFTLGIMPKHLWGDLSTEQLPFSQYNTEPIGSGPFMITAVERDQTGLIDRYRLTSFSAALSTPNLSQIDIRFYQNETALRDALDRREIRATAYLPVEQLASLDRDDFAIITAPLPRVFGIFFNQNRSVVARDRAAREALAAAIDREALIAEALAGYGIPTSAPIVPTGSVLHSPEASLVATSSTHLEAAKAILQAGGWTQNSLGLWEKRIDGAPETLRITLRTSNTPLFGSVVGHIAERWRALGAEVQVDQFEQSDLVQTVIRPRDFEALVFGLDMNRTEDLYPFWHSSQKDDPGLNIAQYTNIAVDRLLEDARVTDDASERARLLGEVAERIAAETPAIMLFAPTLTYVVDTHIRTTPLPAIHRPSDRFITIPEWYANTDTLWPLFNRTPASEPTE